MVPWVEYGTVVSVDAQGVCHIKSQYHGDKVICSARGACHAVVKGSKVRFESLVGKGAHTPAIGLEVAYIAGYLPEEKLAIADVWCSKVNWDKAVAQRDAQPKHVVTEVLPVVAPVQPTPHGTKRKPRRCPTVVPFPQGGEVTAPSETEIAIAN